MKPGLHHKGRADRRGVTASGYGLLVGLIGIVALAAVTTSGSLIKGQFEVTGDRLVGVTGGVDPGAGNQPPNWSGVDANLGTIASSGAMTPVSLSATDPEGQALSYQVVGGSLPGGLSLSSAGQLTGTPSATGSFNFTVRATDPGGLSAELGFTLSVSDLTACGAILSSNPSATDGVYSIDPDGAGPFGALDVWCDMTTDGGGWTLVMRGYGADRTGWSTAPELHASRAQDGPDQLASFRLSDDRINAYRGSSGIYRLQTLGTVYNNTRFFPAHDYLHDAQSLTPNSTSFGDPGLSTSQAIGTQTNDCRGISDYPASNLGGTNLYFVTNRCSNADEWWVGTPGSGFCSVARGCGSDEGHFTMWVR